MTKRDFEAIAAAFRRIPEGAHKEAALRQIVEHCKRSNPRFDTFRFLSACLQV